MMRILLLNLFFLSAINLSAQDNPLQHVRFYDVDDLDFSVFSAAEFQEYYNKTYDGSAYLNTLFSVWKPRTEKISDQDWNTFFKYQDLKVKSPCYGGNYQVHSQAFIQALEVNLPKDQNTYPHFLKLGMTTADVNIRMWPTEEFCFKSVQGAGEGYPFDYAQESLLRLGMPVKILSRTNDGLWYFIDSPNNRGWVMAKSIALVSDEQVNEIKDMDFAAVTQDHLSIQKGSNAVQLHVGMLLPMGYKLDQKYLLVPYRNYKDGSLAFDTIAVDEVGTQPFPIKFDSTNVKMILRELFGTKYSWGGLGGGRDCSSTLQDYFTPFGIRLPRNSVQQYKSGQAVDLSGTTSEKYKIIRQNGIPFLSSVYKRGHIMLYVGTNEQGEPLIYHTVWGLKSYYKDEHLAEVADHKSAFGLFGLSDRNFFNDEVQTRIIIAKTVITTIEPGKLLNAFEKLRIDQMIDHIHTLTLFIN